MDGGLATLLPDYRRALTRGVPALGVAPATDLGSALAAIVAVARRSAELGVGAVHLGSLDTVLSAVPGGARVGDGPLEAAVDGFLGEAVHAVGGRPVELGIGPQDSALARAVLAVTAGAGPARSGRPVTLTVHLDAGRPDPGEGLWTAAVLAAAGPGTPGGLRVTRVLDRAVGPAGMPVPLGGGVPAEPVRLAGAPPTDPEDYLANVLPARVSEAVGRLRGRARSLRREWRGPSTADALVDAGILHADRLRPVLVLDGLAGVVEALLARSGIEAGLGADPDAADLAARIAARVSALAGDPRVPVHAPSLDGGAESPYARIRSLGALAAVCDAGAEGCLELHPAVLVNPRAGVDLVRGAFACGVTSLRLGLRGGEAERVTGFLVRHGVVVKPASPRWEFARAGAEGRPG